MPTIALRRRSTNRYFFPIPLCLILAMALAHTGFWYSSNLSAGDWPQVLGPTRNGVASADEGLAEQWPVDGPPTVWKMAVGSGYAGVAVAEIAGGKSLFLFHRIENQEITQSLDGTTGKERWKNSHPTTFTPQVGGRDGSGPLCVPLLHDGKVVTFGAQGVLTCLDATSGKRLWQRQTHREFAAAEGYFGAGSSPIVMGDNVIVNIGGTRKEAGIVAFSLQGGQTVWTATAAAASYSSPVAVSLAQKQYVLMVTRFECLLLDPASGDICWQFPFGQRGPTVNGASPVVLSGPTALRLKVLVTSSYGIGSVCATFDQMSFEKLWEGDQSLATQYCTPIEYNRSIYCIAGRDDLPPADLTCVEIQTGRVAWTEKNFGYGTLLRAGDKLLAVKTNGEIVLMSPTPVALKVLARWQALEGTVRALPALADGRLYVRDESTLRCLLLK